MIQKRAKNSARPEFLFRRPLALATAEPFDVVADAVGCLLKVASSPANTRFY
jgi:hypothetical protein